MSDHEQMPTTREHKTLAFEVKDLGEGASGNGSFRLYAAVFNNVDRAGEKILPGAFVNLPEFETDGFVAIGHDWKRLPIGTITRAVQDDRGLLVDGEFHSTPEAQACRTVMRERKERGKAVKGSIGYDVLDDARATENGRPIRLLKAIHIYEASFVTVPCNPKAEAVSVKGGTMADEPNGEATPETKVLAEGDQLDDAEPKAGSSIKAGAHVKWGAYCSGMKAGCGMVKSVHKAGVVPGTENDLEASEDEPAAKVMVHGEDHAETDRHMAHPVKHLKLMDDGDEDEKGAATADRKDVATGAASAKGQYLGDTDVTMACAAFEQVHRLLCWFVYGCLYDSRAEKAETLERCSGAIDEYKTTVLGMLEAVLDDDATDAAESGNAAIPPPIGDAYGYSGLSSFLAKMASLDTSGEGAVATLSLEDRSRKSATDLRAIRDAVGRFRDVRLKEGRTLSAATRSRLERVLEALKPLATDLEKLLEDTRPRRDEGTEKAQSPASETPVPAPSPAPADPSAVLRLKADLLQLDMALAECEA